MIENAINEIWDRVDNQSCIITVPESNSSDSSQWTVITEQGKVTIDCQDRNENVHYLKSPDIYTF